MNYSGIIKPQSQRHNLSACEGFDSSVIATVEPASVPRRVLYTFADVPLNARRLVVSQIASTALQEHQRQSQERGFDDGEHARDSLFIGSRWLPAGTKVRKKASPMPTENRYTSPPPEKFTESRVNYSYSIIFLDGRCCSGTVLIGVHRGRGLSFQLLQAS